MKGQPKAFVSRDKINESPKQTGLLGVKSETPFGDLLHEIRGACNLARHNSAGT